MSSSPTSNTLAGRASSFPLIAFLMRNFTENEQRLIQTHLGMFKRHPTEVMSSMGSLRDNKLTVPLSCMVGNTSENLHKSTSQTFNWRTTYDMQFTYWWYQSGIDINVEAYRLREEGTVFQNWCFSVLFELMQ